MNSEQRRPAIALQSWHMQLPCIHQRPCYVLMSAIAARASEGERGRSRAASWAAYRPEGRRFANTLQRDIPISHTGRSNQHMASSAQHGCLRLERNGAQGWATHSSTTNRLFRLTFLFLPL